ncbi:WecB/TagA/CpsF family glycosyltransferase [Palleronia sp. KMU-117]|uniref:WecB/TagA/CpsF family glycosyltransferase n=1 Tax=Palleronia sp. KMU-117 TaxID=3434108 RepID=UPI003D749DE2
MTVDWRTLSWCAPSKDCAVRLNSPSASVLLADLEQRLLDGRGFSVATLNLDHLVKFRRLPGFAESYAGMSHVTADGNPVVWLARLAGQRVKLTPGSELVEPVVEMASRLGVPVGLFGTTDASLDAAAKALTRRYPDLRIVARLSPPMGFDPAGTEAEAMIETLFRSGARVVFLALGAPKQEILASRIARAHPEIGTLSIGAGLDFLSGAQNRAPLWVRKLALEWFWRLMQSPGRLWRRYRDCFLILPGLTIATMRLRLSRKSGERGGEA